METDYTIESDLESMDSDSDYIWDLKKKRIKASLILITTGVSVVFLIAFLMNLALINRAVEEQDLIVITFIIAAIRAAIMGLTSVYLFRTWLKNDQVYLDDAKFLFGLYFLTMTFGKVFDIFWYLAEAHKNTTNSINNTCRVMVKRIYSCSS